MPKSAKRRRDKRKQKKAALASVTPSAQSFKERGTSAFKSGDFARAIRDFTDGLNNIEKIDDELRLALLSNRSAAYSAKYDYENALKDGRKCCELNPRWPKGYVRCGVALIGMSRPFEAKSSFDQALHLDKSLDLKKNTDKCLQIIQELQLNMDEIGGISDKEKKEETEKYKKFVSWMKINGAQINSVYLNVKNKRNRGLHARASMKIDDVLLFVPDKLLLTMDKAKTCKLSKMLLESGYKPQSIQTYMALFLLEQIALGKGSFWYPYINVLPNEFEDHPIFYRKSRLALLFGSIAVDTIYFRIKALRDEYQQLCRHVPAIRKFLFPQFMWARTAVISRVLGVVSDGAKIRAMVPFLDMLNHGKASCKYSYIKKEEKNENSRGFLLKLSQDVKIGDELYTNYGSKGNSRFFINYGFMPRNPCANFQNKGVLIFTMTRDTPFYNEKTKILEKFARRHASGWEHREFEVGIGTDNMDFRRMISFLRYTEAEGKDFSLFRSNFHIEAIGPVSIKNEIAVMKKIASSSRDGLKRYKDTLKMDHNLIKMNRWEDVQQYNCVVMRCSERQVIISVQ